MKKSFLTKTLFFGGSFNPVHNGHLITAKVAAERLGLERICLIPCCQPPHKRSLDLLHHDERARLLRLATLTNNDKPPYFDVMDIEQMLLDGKGAGDGVSPNAVYAYDVVKFLKQTGYTVHWQIGADQLMALPTWHRIEELASCMLDKTCRNDPMCNFVVTERPTYTIDWSKMPDYLQYLRFNLVDVPQVNISASEIRARIKEGKSIRHFVPDSVADAISQNQLYTK